MSYKKEMKAFEKVLDKHIKKRAVVKIERETAEGESDIDGIILNKSSEFLQLIETEEFYLNGQIIIKKDYFDSIRCNEFDKTYKKILKKEGQLKKKNLGTKVDLSSWKSIFKDLRKKDIHVIVDCEDLEEPTFTIGPIEKVGNNSVDIRYYDATGILDAETTKIKFKDITFLKFNDRYSSIFRKYLKKSKK